MAAARLFTHTFCPSLPHPQFSRIQISAATLPDGMRGGSSGGGGGGGGGGDGGDGGSDSDREDGGGARPASPSRRVPPQLMRGVVARAEEQQLRCKRGTGGSLAVPDATTQLGAGAGRSGRERPYSVVASITGASRVAPPYRSPPSLFPACFHAEGEGTTFTAEVR